MIENPLVPGSPVVVEREFPTSVLLEGYRERYGLDVGPLLASTDTVRVCRCGATGYRFYHPFDLAGDGAFYARLQEHEYYMAWKWEHEACSGLIRDGDRILEVGSGRGDFLEEMRRRRTGLDCTGLELNPGSPREEEGLRIVDSTVEEYAASVAGRPPADVVCSFQALEHVPRVRSFLLACIGLLREGGLLVLSVPDNDGFIRHKVGVLNMPPHHMGLWTGESLRRIADHFDVELVDTLYEPLQPYHVDYWLEALYSRLFGHRLSRTAARTVRLLGLRGALRRWVGRRAGRMRGHTVMCVFRKRGEEAS